jgi:hypothetical protein
MKPVADQVHDVFTAAGWSDHSARWAAMRVSTPDAARQIVKAASRVPESIRAVLLKDRRHNADAAIVAAFHEAADVQLLLERFANSAPLRLRNLEAYVHRDGSGERLMSAAEAREKLTNALAELDVHIDTARPLSSAARGAMSNFDEVAAACWALRKGDAK